MDWLASIPACGIATTEPNIGDGWCPACRNSALAMIALTAANASTPATMIFRTVKQNAHHEAALGLGFNGNRTRAAAARGMSSSFATCLGTFLHLMRLV